MNQYLVYSVEDKHLEKFIQWANILEDGIQRTLYLGMGRLRNLKAPRHTEEEEAQ